MPLATTAIENTNSTRSNPSFITTKGKASPVCLVVIRSNNFFIAGTMGRVNSIPTPSATQTEGSMRGSGLVLIKDKGVNPLASPAKRLRKEKANPVLGGSEEYPAG